MQDNQQMPHRNALLSDLIDHQVTEGRFRVLGQVIAFYNSNLLDDPEEFNFVKNILNTDESTDIDDTLKMIQKHGNKQNDQGFCLIKEKQNLYLL